MANKFPLIIDTENGNRISELPTGDNLDLTGSGIINAASVSVNGSITTSSITINGQSLSAVAFSNNFEDLDNVPVGFSGDYNDLINKPTQVISTWDLQDVLGVEPNNGDVLRYNTLNGVWEPESLVLDFDLGNKTLQEIGNVIVTGDVTNKFLKYYAGAWRPANVTYAEVQNAPTNLSQLINDVGYITTVGDDNQTLSFDGNSLTISNGNTVDITQTISYDGSSLSLSNSNTVDTGGLNAIFRTLRTVEGATTDITGSVFGDDSTLLVDGVNGKIVGPVETNSVTATIDNLSLTADNYVIIDSNSNGQINIGQSSGVGNVVIGNRSNGTGVTISGNVNGLVYTKEESTGGSSTGTPTTISLTAVKNLYVLDSADTNDDSWLLPDGVEGQVIHLVPGPGAATNQHYVQITNWRKWDEGAGVAGEWRVRTGLDWMPFKLDNTPLYRSLATAVFVNGAWQTDTPWID